MSQPTPIRFPVALAITSFRRDPCKPGVTNYKMMAAFAMVSSAEAIGAGLRLGEEKYPRSDGWGPPDVSASFIGPSGIAEATASYAEAAKAGILITEDADGITITYPDAPEASP